MQIESQSYTKFLLFYRIWGVFRALPANLSATTVDFAKNTKKIGKDDPRRVIHSIKVGLALTLVSMFYYSQPLYDGFGVSAMWAVMTVVVVFEFSVGATIGKGINRGMATLLAGGLGVGAHHLASISGKVGEPILIGLCVFLQAAIATFIRFHPKVKARYDYGVLIFILTFCLVSVSSYRNDEILEFAHKRLISVIIGTFTCVIVSISVCPVWAGEELHDQVALNIEVLGNFLTEYGDKYLETSNGEKHKGDKSVLQAYKNVLNSKSSDEIMANFARWEPSHGPFSYKHPWMQYLKIGTLTRECACLIQTLNGCLCSKIDSGISVSFQKASKKLSIECGKALKKLALSIKKMSKPCSADPHIENSKAATKKMQLLFKSCLLDRDNILEFVPVATLASILNDIVICTEKIAKSVNELALLAHFDSENVITKPCHSSEPVSKTDCSHIVVAVSGPSSDCLRIGNRSSV